MRLGKGLLCGVEIGRSHGRVTGVDMTPQQLNVARKHADAYASVIGYANMSFIQGTIENLSAIPSDSIDIIISNCVVNLSPDKPAVLKEAYRVLRHGGEFYFSGRLWRPTAAQSTDTTQGAGRGMPWRRFIRAGLSEDRTSNRIRGPARAGLSTHRRQGPAVDRFSG